jgi:hypothetical protein
MMNAFRITRTLGTAAGGLLAVGFGIGAVLAGTGVASADSSTDPFSLIDDLLGGLAVPAQTSALDMQVSIDGFELFPTAGNTATATSGTGDIAIAIGNGSNATATGGFGDFANASGTDATASATGGNFDVASASSVFSTTGGTATAGNGSFDVAQEGGLNGVATADNGSFDSAFALTGASGSAVAQFGNGDSATDIGDGSAIAGGTSDSLLGNSDIADNFGSLMQAMAGSSDIAPGSFDLAAILAGGTPDATATGANFLVEILPSL